MLKLYEEVGELAQYALIHRKKCRPEKYLSRAKAKEELAKELADILGLLIVNAYFPLTNFPGFGDCPMQIQERIMAPWRWISEMK